VIRRDAHRNGGLRLRLNPPYALKPRITDRIAADLIEVF